MSIGRLIVEFEARTGKFETDTGRAAKLMEKRAREIDAQVRKIGVAVGAAIGAAAVGIGALVKKSIDAADEMSKLAQKVGVSTEALSQLQHAANLSGVEDLGGALAKFNRTAGEAAQGTKEQAEAFKTLGVEIRNTDGTLKNTETLFTETAEAISKMPDGIKKTQVAMDLFGKSGAQLIPLLNLGKEGLDELRKEADALGLTLDERTGRAAEGFNDNLTRLGTVANGIGTRLASQFAPELERITGLMVQTAKDTGAVTRAAEALATAFKGLVLVGSVVSNTFQILGKEIGGLAAAAGAALSGDFKRAADILRMTGEDQLQDLRDIRDAYRSLFGDAPANLPRTPGRTGGDVIVDQEAEKARTKAADDAAKESERQAKAIRDHIAALNEESAAFGLNREQLEARKVAQMGATDVQVQQTYEVAKYIRLQQEAADADEERARIFEATRTPAEEYAATIERLNMLFDYGRKDVETYTRAVEQAADRMDAALNKNKDKSTEKVDEWSKTMQGIAEEAGRSIQRSLSDFLFNPFEGGLKGMVRSFAQTLQRMAADLLASSILQKLGSLFSASGGGAGGGGFWATAASAFGSFFGGGKASGGPVMAGVPYLVGERGPELMVPSTSGKIVPNNALGGGQPNIRIVNAFDMQVIDEYMNSSAGEKTFLNLARRNGAKMRNFQSE